MYMFLPYIFITLEYFEVFPWSYQMRENKVKLFKVCHIQNKNLNRKCINIYKCQLFMVQYQFIDIMCVKM